MIGHDALGTLEPEVRDPGQDLALARDGLGQDDVEGGQAVGGDDQQVMFVQLITVVKSSQL